LHSLFHYNTSTKQREQYYRTKGTIDRGSEPENINVTPRSVPDGGVHCVRTACSKHLHSARLWTELY
jgi:hypothetical protein